MSTKTLYERLGGYDAMCAVSDDLLPRLMSDSRLKRFWEHRGEDGIKRENNSWSTFSVRVPADPCTTPGEI